MVGERYVPVSISNLSRGRLFKTFRLLSVFSELNIAYMWHIHGIKVQAKSCINFITKCSNCNGSRDLSIASYHPLMPIYNPKSIAAVASSKVPSNECTCTHSKYKP